MATNGDITLKKISKSFGTKILFEDVNMTFNQGNRYGLTGPNGAGKSTLLKIMMGLEEATRGEVSLPERVGILKQNIEAFADYKVLDVVIMGNEPLWAAFAERDALYAEEITDEIGMRLGELEGIIAEEGGYTADVDAEMLLAGMLIEENTFHMQMRHIPTDQQFKVLLCQALFGDPQALLLDEPTNHLDLESITWLETFLEKYRGTLIVISHDRHFLNSVTTHIADIDYETIIVYPGNYDEMVEAKTAGRQRAELESKNKEKKIAQLRDFVARFGAGTRASQVKSRVKEMKRLQPQDLKESNIQRPYIRFFPSESQSGKIPIKLKTISKGYDGNEVIKHFSFELNKGDKIGIIGNNGRGKTTLMELLAGASLPDSGEVELGNQVKRCYFPQNHSSVIDKKDNSTAFDWLKSRHENIYDQDVRAALGKMLFGGDDAFKQVATLSGGETARLILAHMMLSDHNLLLLDEPNNHLDLEAVSALAWGLEDYPETVVVVSHDRDLISTVAKKLIVFEEDGIRLFEGTLEEYMEK